MKNKLTKEEIIELQKLQRDTDFPKEEEKIIPLIENKYKINKKEIRQYKINIPKKFSDFLKLDKDKFKVKSTLDKANNKLIFEVFRNE